MAAAGRKKRRASRYDGESESSKEDEVDNSGALVQYQPAADFTQHLANLLKAEPSSPVGGRWGEAAAAAATAAPPSNLSSVDAAFNSMNLAPGNIPPGVTIKDEGLGRMPHIPGTSPAMVSLSLIPCCGTHGLLGKFRWGTFTCGSPFPWALAMMESVISNLLRPLLMATD